MAIKDNYEQDYNSMIEEYLPLLNDQEEYELFKDNLSDEVHDMYDDQVDTCQEKKRERINPIIEHWNSPD